MINGTLQYERIGLATEKSDILTGLPLNNSGTITGDSKMKTCYKCKQTKPLSRFHKDCTTIDGHSNKCRICRLKYNKEYRQTEKGIIAHRKSNNRYQKTEKGKATERRYGVKYPERRKAKHAVYSAIRTDTLIRPDTFICCVRDCLNQAEQYHHNSYEQEHWLNVLPVCKKCHKNIHRKAI